MAKRYTLRNGESSFDGINPASVKYCGILECGYHNNKEGNGCVVCGKFTHYSLHRRYKFNKNIENAEDVDRAWLCSNECAKAMVFRNMFGLTLPFEVAEQVINWTGK